MKPTHKLMIAVKYGADKKTRWVQVGTVFKKESGQSTILLDAGVNLAAYAQDGKVWANIFPFDKRPATGGIGGGEGKSVYKAPYLHAPERAEYEPETDPQEVPF